MAFVAAPNIIEIEWRCLRYGQKIENRIMVDILGTPPEDAAPELAELAWNWWENTHSDHLHTSVQLASVVATDLSVQDGFQSVYAPDSTTTGALGGDGMPNECSFCLQLTTGKRGRSSRGRFYTLSVTRDQMATDNELLAESAGEFVSDLLALRTAIVALPYQWVVVSYVSNGAPRPGGPVYSAISGVKYTDLLIDSMKRRKPGVGS